MVNKVYINPEATVTWSDTGGDETLDLGGLAADAVRVGDRHDFGATARSEWFEWRVLIDGFTAAPVVAEAVDFYISTSDGTIEDGEVGTVDAAGATTDLPNLHYIGSAVVQTTTAGDNLQTGGIVRIVSRYASPVVHNNTANVLQSAADNHNFILTPIPPEIQ